MESLQQLCLACGLCCDGTLFDSVRLGAGDDAKKLKTLGLPVRVTRTAPAATFFRQPCVALCADRTCQVYADRPAQCRTFECRVFQDAKAERITPAVALQMVTQARRLVEKVRRLLRALGDADEHLSLSERFRQTQKRMETETTDLDAGLLFGKLGLAVHQLSLLTHDKFHIRVDESGRTDEVSAKKRALS
ncbi:YkgJ family cysteine cluster protein [Oleiharenicola lentus]|uniref:YkgJ family cysteine cluster protein n=1 Tax=Oleiharenicola lentus TaxID=2508720 RepID=UPI003F671DD7